MRVLGEKKKRHPISKIPLSGPSCEEFPLFSSYYTLPPPFFPSLLCFFNQAVWGCQVFWDEDSQPCEKLIPCGPSSPHRSSPWEHWWCLASRWQWVGVGGKEVTLMKGQSVRWGTFDQWLKWEKSTDYLQSFDTNTKPHTCIYCLLLPTEHFQCATIPVTAQTALPFSRLLPICTSSKSKTFWWKVLAWLTDGWNREERICDVKSKSSGFSRVTLVQNVECFCCIVPQTSLPWNWLNPLTLGFNRSAPVILLWVKAKFPPLGPPVQKWRTW